MEPRVRSFSNDQALIDERRRHIVECSIRLFVKRGFHQVTTREVAKACNMSQGLIYHYVASKQDVLFLCMNYMNELHGEFLERMDGEVSNLHPVEALRQAIKIYFDWMDKNQDWVIFVDREIANLSKNDRSRLLGAESSSVAFFEKLFSRGVEAGIFDVDDIPLAAHNILVLGHAWAARRWFLKQRWTLDDYTAKHTEHILKLVTFGKRHAGPTDGKKRPVTQLPEAGRSPKPRQAAKPKA